MENHTFYVIKINESSYLGGAPGKQFLSPVSSVYARLYPRRVIAETVAEKYRIAYNVNPQVIEWSVSGSIPTAEGTCESEQKTD